MIKNTTTTTNSWYGAKSLAMFYSMFPIKVPPLRSAISKSDLIIQEEVDALTPTTLAILTLLVILIRSPFAAVAHIRSSVMCFYMVMINILNVVLLAIKAPN